MEPGKTPVRVVILVISGRIDDQFQDGGFERDIDFDHGNAGDSRIVNLFSINLKLVFRSSTRAVVANHGKAFRTRRDGTLQA